MSIRVALDSGAISPSSGHAVRGIGFMVRDQIKALRDLKDKDIKLDTFDFESSEGKNKLKSGNYDIVHYSLFFPYAVTLPDRKLGKKVVVTIQDLIHMVYPDKYPPGLRGKMNLLKQKSRLKNVDAVLTVSETSKKDIVRLLNYPPEKVDVNYLYPSDFYKKETDKKILAGVKKKYRLPDKFVLYVGDINYNKNILNLIKACEIAKIPLVIAGKQAKEIEMKGMLSLMDLKGPMDWYRFLFDKPHPENAHYQAILEKYQSNNKNILRLGFVPNEEMSALYALASVYCQPSYYEGFGLPVIQAFVCEIPVLVSRTNCLVEIAGGAALTADPDNPEDMAGKITELVKDRKLRNKLILKGGERLKTFNARKTAEGMVRLYKKLMLQ